nr:Dihydrofolate reductase [uncultured bacterium]AIA13898.1 Dihydrofolate reductase [uncultured bacterium]
MTIKSIIVVIDENNAIGKNNGLLCHLPNDLKHFKAITEGHTVIMGRKTFDSLPKGALPNRRNIVVSRNADLQYAGCEMCGSVQEAFDLCKDEDEVFVIGGGSIYRETIGMADVLYVTRIHHEFEDADTFFPSIEPSVWKEAGRERHDADEKNKYKHSFIKFEKIKP